MNIMRWFYILTTALYMLGVILNVADNKSDIFQLWVGCALVIGWYLIEKRKSK